MRNSQKEIAAPQACNKYFLHILFAAAAIVLIVFFAVVAHAETTGMFKDKTALSACILTFLLLILSPIIVAIFKKTALTAAVFGIFAVFSAIAVLVLALAQNSLSKVLFESFTGTMLFVLLSSAAFVGGAAAVIAVFRRDKMMVLAAIYCLLFSISALFCFFLRYTPPKSANKLWAIAGFSAGVAVLICVISCFAVSGKKVVTTKWITYCATFAALSVVCKMMGNTISFLPNLKFTPVYVPWVIAGIVLGPAGGMITAFVGDIVGQLLVPSGMGDLNPYITLANTLFPLFPALLYKFAPKNHKNWLPILIGMVISTLVCSLGINTYGLWFYYYKDTNFWAYFVQSRIYQPLVIGLNFLLIMWILPVLKRAHLTELKFLTASEPPNPEPQEPKTAEI